MGDGGPNEPGCSNQAPCRCVCLQISGTWGWVGGSDPTSAHQRNSTTTTPSPTPWAGIASGGPCGFCSFLTSKAKSQGAGLLSDAVVVLPGSEPGHGEVDAWRDLQSRDRERRGGAGHESKGTHRGQHDVKMKLLCDDSNCFLVHARGGRWVGLVRVNTCCTYRIWVARSASLGNGYSTANYPRGRLETTALCIVFYCGPYRLHIARSTSRPGYQTGLAAHVPIISTLLLFYPAIPKIMKPTS